MKKIFLILDSTLSIGTIRNLNIVPDSTRALEMRTKR